jgi:lipopolysaccharide export LptBFGC system permease protein LptF
MVILGLALALRHNQVHLTSVVALGMGLMFIYWLFFGFSASFGQAGRWPPLWAVTCPHLVFGGLALGLLRRVTT